MASLLIVYHSQSGNGAWLARAAAEGATTESGCEVKVMRACDAATADLRRASGLMLVAAENSGALSGESKAFLDRVFYPAIEAQLVLPYALLVGAGNDGRGAVRQAQRILSGIPFTPACEPLILRGEAGAPECTEARELGQAFAAGLVMGIF